MSLIQRVSPLGAPFIANRQLLTLDRPTLLLACLCVLSTYSSHSWPCISTILLANFPELLIHHSNPFGPDLATNLRHIWHETRRLRPEWLDGMRRGEGLENAGQVLGLLERRAFSCSCLYPEGWRDWQQGEVDVFWYLRALLYVGARARTERGWFVEGC